MRKESEKAQPIKVLVVEDDRLMLRLLEEKLRQGGFEPALALDGEEGERIFSSGEFDVVLTDVMMPKVSGIELLERIKERDPDLPIIMLTGSGSGELLGEALDKGAYYYMTKPPNYDALFHLLKRAAKDYALIRDNRRLAEAVGKRFRFENIICSSGRMQEVLSLIAKIANSNASVLIQGESGTGKELVARAIHYNSPRREDPFIALNCAAIPRELMESELFGHMKGSFTGAIADKKGKFEMADRGSIFLDEIGDLDLSLQAKILRVLQEREFERVGGTQRIRVNIRLIAATNKNLSQGMRGGTFREDLFYRLSVIPLLIPPLRDRREDIPALSEHFLGRFSQDNGKEIRGLSPKASAALMAYDWPGNVRELENCIERAVVMAEGSLIRLQDLPQYLQGGEAEEEQKAPPREGVGKGVFIEVGKAMREVEREYILRTLEEMGGKRKKTADVLGISERSLRDKLKEFGYSSTRD